MPYTDKADGMVLTKVNSFPPSATYMRLRIESALVQIMAWYGAE